MDDPDVTAAVPGPTPPGGGRLSDAALGALFDAASPAFATQPTTPSRGWQPPTVEMLQHALPQYEISAFIARGGMGAVYQGVQRSLHRPVAIKVLPPEMEAGDLQFAGRFKREAQSMAQLSHPNIVAVYDAGETSDGLLYFVMEHIEGTDVARLIASERHLDPQRAMSITSSVCDALAFAHEEGIIHRDIKPSNIMIDRKGRVKVADFGLAKAVNMEGSTLLTGSRVAVGTPDFIAPEAHIPGVEVDQRADLYAVGVMLYQMLTGRIPRGRFDPPSSLIPQIDPRLDAIVDKAMQTEPERRYSTATEMKTDVEKVVQGFSPRTPVNMQRNDPAQRRAPGLKPKTTLLIAAAVIALAAGGFLLVKSNSKPGAAAGPSAAPALPSKAASAPTSVPGGAAGPGALTAAYPPGQWVEVFSKPGDVPPNAQGAADLQWSDGWLVPGRMPLRLACPVTDASQGVGARFRFRGVDTNENFLQLRGNGPAGYVLRLTNSGQCTIAHMKLGSPGLMFAGGRPARETEIIATATLPAPLKAGDEYRLEFLAIGSRLIGRFNGKVVCEASDTRLPAGQSSIYGYAPMRDLAIMALDKLPEAEALKLAGMDATAGGAPALQSASKSDPRYPVGQWVRHYQKAADIHQKWFDAGAKWEEGWITPGAGFNQSISLGAPNAQGRNWGARVRIRCGGGGFAGLVLRRNGTATSNTVSNYEFRVTQKGGAEFVRGQGRGSVSGADRKPLGDPFPIPLIDGQEVLIEAFAIGDTLYGRVEGQLFTTKTDGELKEGGIEVATQIMPCRDIEFINLDGLTEAEAKKAVGVGE